MHCHVLLLCFLAEVNIVAQPNGVLVVIVMMFFAHDDSSETDRKRERENFFQNCYVLQCYHNRQRLFFLRSCPVINAFVTF